LSLDTLYDNKIIHAHSSGNIMYNFVAVIAALQKLFTDSPGLYYSHYVA